MIGHDAVDLFGHGFVERAQPRLNVDDGHKHFGSGDGAGECRVGVAVKHQEVGAELAQLLLDADDHAGGLFAMRGRTNVELVVGSGNM